MVEKNEVKFLLNYLLELFGGRLVSVVIFGSRARKNYGNYSDLDLIVIIDNGEEGYIEKFRINYLLRFGKKLDVHFFSKMEAIDNFNHFSPIFCTLILGRTILFDKEMFFENLFRKFVKDMANENIKYCEKDKIWELKKIAKDLEILH